MNAGETPTPTSFPGGFPPSEWVRKARGDLDVARRVAEGIENTDAVGFHCQQAIEKLMKAALVNAGVVPPKVHDLPELLRRLTAAGVDWDWSLTDLRTLSVAAVHSRYPGYSISSEEAADLLKITSAIWASLHPLI